MASKPINIRWISHTEKSCITSYYRQFFTKIKIKISLVGPSLQPLGFNKTGSSFNVSFHYLLKSDFNTMQ